MNDWLRTMLFLPPQSSSLAMSLDHLHFFVILTTMAGATFVALLALYFTLRHRRPIGQVTTQKEAAPTTPGSVEWMIAGGLFSLFLAWWIVGFMQYVRMRVAPEHTYDVYVTAKQWMWKFAYPDGQHTISELYVPAGRPVKLIMTSRDVIHSFFVPDFRAKQDVIPGRYTTIWFEAREPGRHDIFCAEYCGTNHSMMRAQVIVLDPSDFARWQSSAPVDEETPPPPRQDPAIAVAPLPSPPVSLPRLGETIAGQEGCLRCHTLDGSPHIGPTWAGLYLSQVPLEGGGSAVADEAYLTESMMDPRARIRAGFKSVMPSYLGRLRPAEVSAIVELIKSLRDVRGDNLTPAAHPVGHAAAGAIGVPPDQEARPLEQPVRRDVLGPPPAEQGLPPPPATVLPPATGDVVVGPEGQPNKQAATPPSAQPAGEPHAPEVAPTPPATTTEKGAQP